MDQGIYKENNDSILIGITIQNGIDENGGGIYCGYQSSPTITHCIIKNNSASNNGGGIYCDVSSSPTITNCILENNSSTNGGGGLYYNSTSDDGGGICCRYLSSPTISNCKINSNSAAVGGGISCLDRSSPNIIECTIIDNSSKNGGGILCNIDSNLNISDCLVKNNSSSGFGGGISCYNSSSPIIINSCITNNFAGDGGGISCDNNSSANITGCNIRNNSATFGGGIYCDSSSPIIINCAIINNLSSSGGGISCRSSDFYGKEFCPSIINCTISDNTAYEDGGILNVDSLLIITNCIIWGNYPTELFCYNGNIEATYSDIQQDAGIYPGIGNINSDPLFVNSEQGNFYISANSPCIDTATDTNGPSCDKEGIIRPQGPGLDMGAYEYVDPNVCIPRASFSANQFNGLDSLTVELNVSSSGGSKCNDAIFSWDFGDGTSISGHTVSKISHTYSKYGLYDVNLVITTGTESHKLTLYDLIKIKSSQVTKEVGEGYDYSSIQDAIDDSVYSEIILVHDGVYIENINFKGKTITICSENGPKSSFIDGNKIDSVVTFNKNENSQSVLKGFTIRNGLAKKGGGILCLNSSL